MRLTLESKEDTKYKIFLVEFDDEDREKGVLTAIVGKAELELSDEREISYLLDEARVYREDLREKYILTLELIRQDNGEVFSLEYYDDEVDDA